MKYKPNPLGLGAMTPCWFLGEKVMKILVTGGTGRIGSNFVKKL